MEGQGCDSKAASCLAVAGGGKSPRLDPGGPFFAFCLGTFEVLGTDEPVEVKQFGEFYGPPAEAHCGWGWRCRF